MLDPATAEGLLVDAEGRNPGPWAAHSRHAAAAARAIATADGRLDAERAYAGVLLHDIGRREGRTSMRHVLDGYRFLRDQGHEAAARICMTHSFPVQNTDAVFGEWDCTAEERGFVDQYIADVRYDEYDRLAQLCDALALPSGIVLLEKRMVDVAVRYGTNRFTAAKWRATLEIRDHFAERLGGSIYRVLPGVVEATFGEGAVGAWAERSR